MKLELSKEWFEKQLPHEALEVGAGNPAQTQCIHHTPEAIDLQRENHFIEGYAFGTLVQLLRRQRRLTVHQLADEAQITAPELLNIEADPRHIPRPGTVHQIASYFDLPSRQLIKLANVTTVHSDRLRDAAARFAASSSNVMELSCEERAALTEFVEFLASQGAD